jgi:hypothetical protein
MYASEEVHLASREPPKTSPAFDRVDKLPSAEKNKKAE